MKLRDRLRARIESVEFRPKTRLLQKLRDKKEGVVEKARGWKRSRG